MSEPSNEAKVNPAATVAINAAQTDLDEAYRLSKALALSSLLPDALRGKPSDVLVTILYGQELGLAPMQAIRGINVVKGRPQMSGQLWIAKVRQAGHRLTVTEHTDESCTVTIRRGDTGEEHAETFKLADAVASKLVAIKDGKPFARSSRGEALPWETFTKRLLLWRCVTNAATIICPEVALGFGVTGDEAIPSEPEPPSLAKVAAERTDRTAEPPSPPGDPGDDEAMLAEVADIEATHTQPPADGDRWDEVLLLEQQEEQS